MRPQKPDTIGKSKATFVESNANWGLYFWRLPDGHLLSDGAGNMLNIPSTRNDFVKTAQIRQAASHYGFPEGEPWFYAGVSRATDEEFAEQKDRLKDGLIPTMNDIGAVMAAKQGLKTYGGSDND